MVSSLGRQDSVKEFSWTSEMRTRRGALTSAGRHTGRMLGFVLEKNEQVICELVAVSV